MNDIKRIEKCITLLQSSLRQIEQKINKQEFGVYDHDLTRTRTMYLQCLENYYSLAKYHKEQKENEMISRKQVIEYLQSRIFPSLTPNNLGMALRLVRDKLLEEEQRENLPNKYRDTYYYWVKPFGCSDWQIARAMYDAELEEWNFYTIYSISENEIFAIGECITPPKEEKKCN